MPLRLVYYSRVEKYLLVIFTYIYLFVVAALSADVVRNGLRHRSWRDPALRANLETAMATFPPEIGTNGVLTSFIPLTTTFIPPTACWNELVLRQRGLVAFDPLYNSLPCVPPPAVTSFENLFQLLAVAQPSPTSLAILPLNCPESWSTAATGIQGHSTTAVLCCPL